MYLYKYILELFGFSNKQSMLIEKTGSLDTVDAINKVKEFKFKDTITKEIAENKKDNEHFPMAITI